MVTKLSPEARAELAGQGVAISGDIGGLQKQRYWTQDGREIMAIPAIRTYRRVRDKKIVGEGVRDANFDKGWLLQPPAKLKPYCPHCDKWHDTQKEIDDCGEKKGAFNKKWMAKAKKMKHQEGDGEVEGLRTEVSELKSDMSDIKDMLTQLLAKKE